MGIGWSIKVISYQLSVVSYQEIQMQDFRKLLVWQKAHRVTLDVYKITKDFPGDELYGLTSQMRRAAASIGANISEGCGKESRLDFARYLQNAAGSSSELEYHVLLARDLGYLSPEGAGLLTSKVSEVKRMLSGLMQRLRKSDAAHSTAKS